MNFYDKYVVDLKAGNGGNGIVSWRREANYPMGGPWGGNGGDGGSIIIVADHNKSSLIDLFSFKKIEAESGENGKNKLCHGKNGKDVYLKVPLGTEVIDFYSNKKIVDITDPNQKYIICKGGKGGKGNAYFKSSFNKIPSLYENGELGQELKVTLNLKYIADVGIIGMPNAGKSTFINQISNAKSKIGNYQFTTIKPVLGTINFKDNKIVFADIPGLIEDAHLGVGLGFEFLKHIERCHFLIHMISCELNENEDVVKIYETINNELKNYNKILLKKKIFVVLNKIDAVENYKIVYQQLKKHLKNKKIYLISAINNLGIDELIDDIFKEYIKYQQEVEANKKDDEEILYVTAKPTLDSKLKVERIDDHYWKVKSDKINYWFNRIPLTTNDNNVRFIQKIDIEYIQKELMKKGAQKNDTFSVCNIEFIID